MENLQASTTPSLRATPSPDEGEEWREKTMKGEDGDYSIVPFSILPFSLSR